MITYVMIWIHHFYKEHVIHFWIKINFDIVGGMV